MIAKTPKTIPEHRGKNPGPGALKVPMNRFLKADFIASFFWMAVVGGLAYFSALAFDYLRRYLKVAELGLLLGLVVLFLLAHVIAVISKRKFGEFKQEK